MSHYGLPVGGFEWISTENIDLLSLNTDGDYTYIVDVDVDYPASLHALHDYFPFLPTREKPPGDNVEKLLLTLHDKRNYVCHLKNLQQACKHGLKLVKCHSILRCKQTFWLRPYILGNNERRSASTNESTRNLYKLLNNSLFGRLCMDKTKFKDVFYVSDEAEMTKLVKKKTISPTVQF